ncbi:MAG: hypothetical protein KC479_00245 [Dehalococcoidia bacterium]|nr:hypothetical protein [Dehalococcoidia bacterium]
MNRRNRLGICAVASLALATVLWTGVAVAADYDTASLNHGGGTCIGYGWADSEHPNGVYAGTSKTGGPGPCYMKVDSYIEYNDGSVFNPSETAWKTWNTFQGAGPGGAEGDYVSALHKISWIGGSGQYDDGTTEAFD